MNIQIFGTSKCFDSKKAMRYFKERGIKYQWIDMKEKGLSKGEYTKVKQAVGGLDAMLNPKCKDQDTLALIKYMFFVKHFSLKKASEFPVFSEGFFLL